MKKESPIFRATVMAIGVAMLSFGAYGTYLDNRIMPHTMVGSVSLGGLTRSEAEIRLQAALDVVTQSGIRLDIEGVSATIDVGGAGLDMNVEDTVGMAFSRGHRNSAPVRAVERIASLWRREYIVAPIALDRDRLIALVSDAMRGVQVPRQDVRLAVIGSRVRLLTDTKSGKIADLEAIALEIMRIAGRLGVGPVAVRLKDDPPRADVAMASAAVVQAQKMISRPLTILYEDAQFVVTPTRVGSWVTSLYEGPQLKIGLDRRGIDRYVATIAKALNAPPEPIRITTSAGQIVGFVPPKVGRTVQQSALTDMIISALMARVGADKHGDTLVVPMKTTRVATVGLDASSGISELIGKATTPFTGSPKNRIINIKNGIRFLSGAIVQPGQEFSTLQALGVVDDAAGYLPELVIKGTRSEPEFGGGLCQVSTTLFRAVLDAGLPVTSRRNHSYRVTYYEKDGNGKTIGPGLDATIYQPNPDFKFFNDMTTPVLIVGYVAGDKATFELYGTKDGRTSRVAGPKLLYETPAGDAVDIPTDTLPMGMRKQVETPHPGGSAVATYYVTYADGRTVSQEFRSWYRPWPAKYLVGTNPDCSTAAQCASLVNALPPSPTP